MIVHRIALSNIKSCGALDISLHPGVNFIAGRNGAGKTTLIEAVGFAIFDYPPATPYAEYFLRHGEKQGEIRVTFSHGGETFTVVRKVGKANTSKVLDESGLELDLHGQADVQSFILDKLGMPKGENIGRLFETVIGIPQGTFTAPFLEIPSKRKETFERILKVEDYRQASDALRAFSREFLLGKEAMLSGKLEGLRVQTGQLDARAKEYELAGNALERARTEAEAAEKYAQEAETANKQWQESERAVLESRQKRELGAQRAVAARAACSAAAEALAEAETAGARALESLGAHEVYSQARQAFQALEAKRRTRDALAMRRLALRNKIEQLEHGLEDWREKQAQAQAWEASLAAMPQVKAEAAALEQAEKALADARERFALARKDVLEERRVQTALMDNRCPYHERACLQQAELLGMAQERRQALETRVSQVQAEADGAEARAKALQQSRARLQMLEKTREDLDALKITLPKFPLAAQRCVAECVKATEGEFACVPPGTLEEAEKALEAMRSYSGSLNASIEVFAEVEGQLEQARAAMTANEARHLEHVRQSALAETADDKRKALASLQAAAAEEEKRLANLMREHQSAEKAYDEGEAHAARENMLQKRDALGLARARLETWSRESERLRRELETLRELDRQRKETEAALADARTASEYAKDAADALREMGERMAANYRERLGAQAQDWYRQISSEAVSLCWTGDYDIRLTDVHEGEARQRGFKQLSGGEQMTAALAMRMALLQAFSGVGFACFDEPTTGLDEHRRSALAAALAQVTDVFDQAIIVSHDDTFDALSENVLHLSKDASGATELCIDT